MLLLFMVLYYFLLEICCGGEKVMGEVLVFGIGGTGLHSPNPGKRLSPTVSWVMDICIQRGARGNVEMKCPRQVGWGLEQFGIVECVSF